MKQKVYNFIADSLLWLACGWTLTALYLHVFHNQPWGKFDTVVLFFVLGYFVNYLTESANNI